MVDYPYKYEYVSKLAFRVSQGINCFIISSVNKSTDIHFRRLRSRIYSRRVTFIRVLEISSNKGLQVRGC